MNTLEYMKAKQEHDRDVHGVDFDVAWDVAHATNGAFDAWEMLSMSIEDSHREESYVAETFRRMGFECGELAAKASELVRENWCLIGAPAQIISWGNFEVHYTDLISALHGVAENEYSGLGVHVLAEELEAICNIDEDGDRTRMSEACDELIALASKIEQFAYHGRNSIEEEDRAVQYAAQCWNVVTEIVLDAIGR